MKLGKLAVTLWQAALIALVIAAVVFGVSQCSKARNAAREADLSGDQAGAVADSAADAVGTVGAVGSRAGASDRITMENDDDIRNAEGADRSVAPAVDAAGRRSLCRRAAYSGSAECLRLAAPAGVEGRRARSTTAER